MISMMTISRCTVTRHFQHGDDDKGDDDDDDNDGDFDDNHLYDDDYDYDDDVTRRERAALQVTMMVLVDIQLGPVYLVHDEIFVNLSSVC